VPGHGALHSLRPQKKVAAEKWGETHFSSIEEKEKWIEDYVERETASARKRVDNAEEAIQQEQEDTKKAEYAGLTNKDSEKTFQEMMVAIRDSLSNHASSDNGEDREDEEDEETEQGQLSDDDKPGWVMSTMTKTVQRRKERFRQQQINLGK